MGYVVLDPRGGQVPWHNQEQEEVYMVLQGRGEICVGPERKPIKAGQAVFLPPREFHQLTNTGDAPMHMMYIYCPGGDVPHWRQELEGTLPAPGHAGTPPLPFGAALQCREKPEPRQRPSAEKRPARGRFAASRMRRDATRAKQP